MRRFGSVDSPELVPDRQVQRQHGGLIDCGGGRFEGRAGDAAYVETVSDEHRQPHELRTEPDVAALLCDAAGQFRSRFLEASSCAALDSDCLWHEFGDSH
jgi:hypothetical protein